MRGLYIIIWIHVGNSITFFTRKIKQYTRNHQSGTHVIKSFVLFQKMLSTKVERNLPHKTTSHVNSWNFTWDCDSYAWEIFIENNLNVLVLHVRPVWHSLQTLVVTHNTIQVGIYTVHLLFRYILEFIPNTCIYTMY